MHVSNTFSILFWLHTAKQKDNLAPIYARITVNGKRTEISLKRTVSVTSWDSSKNRVTGRTDRVKSINSFLDQTHAKLQDCYSQLQSELKLITAQSIKARFLGADENHKTLLELIKYHNTNMNGTIKRGTMKNYFSTEKYLKKFLLKKIKSNDIYLKHISYSFIVDFETFLRTAPTLKKHQPLSNNGIMKHLERLKKLINLALKLEWIDKDPFARYSLKFTKFDRVYLNKEELEQLEGTSFKNTTHQKTRDVFVFACYTGLSYADIKTLTSSHIVRGINGEYWIYTRREKSNTSVKVPLLDKALSIIKKYDENQDSSSNQVLLPVCSNQKMNKYLKEVMQECKIHKKITFHAARHTFATTVTLSNGVPIETVSKLLGHTKITTTQIYSRVLEQKIGDDMFALKTKLNMATKDDIYNQNL